MVHLWRYLNQCFVLGYESCSSTEYVTVAGVSSTFMYGPVSLQKVWFEENIKDVPCQTLNGVIYGEDVDLFPVLDIRAGMDTVITHMSTGT